MPDAPSGSVSFPLNSDDDRPLPLIVAERWNFPLQHHFMEGQYWYAVLDWIAGLTAEDMDKTRKMWAKMQHSELLHETSASSRHLDYRATDGKVYQRDFVSDKGLYFIAQHLRSTQKRVLLKDIKQYLADSGAFADFARRDPTGAAAQLKDYAEDKELRKLMERDGFTLEQAKEWREQRIKVIGTRKWITGIWYGRGAHQKDFGRLTNRIDRVVHGKTATERKKEMGLPKHDTPRNYDAAADLALTAVVEMMAGTLHEWRDSEGVSELEEDIDDTKPIIDGARPGVYQAFSKKRRRLPGKPYPRLPDEIDRP